MPTCARLNRPGFGLGSLGEGAEGALYIHPSTGQPSVPFVPLHKEVLRQMKYQGIRTVYIIFAILLSVMAVYGAAVSILRWEDYDVGVRVFLVVELCAIFAALFYVLFSLRRPVSSAEFRADGIHMLSKEAGELGFLDWKDVKDCRLISCEAYHVGYVLLILQWAAPFGGKPVSMCRNYRLSDMGTIQQHRLDELTQKLAEGTMKAEELKDLPYLFFVADDSMEKYLALWRARRMACRDR